MKVLVFLDPDQNNYVRLGWRRKLGLNYVPVDASEQTPAMRAQWMQSIRNGVHLVS
jgi:hypothetical protein